jgi:HlyD family secretion protein
MRKAIIIMLIMAVAGAAAVYSQWGRIAGAGDEGTLRAYGNVEIREVNLGFRVSGRVSEVLVEEGDSVEPGQKVALLDAEPYRRELQSARARREAAAAELERYEAGYRFEEIAQAEARLNERKATLRRTDRELARQRRLQDSNASTEQDLDRAVAAHEEAQARVDLAEASLELLRSGFRVEDVRAARARLAEAEARIEELRLRLSDCELYAPSKGSVLVRAVEPGAFVGVGQTALSLSLSGRTWVRAYIPQNRLGDIAPGMRARVYTDSRPDKPYTGQIGFIAPQAEFTPKNVETEELRSDLVFRFRVVIDNPDEGLRQGMPVTVELAGGNGEDV